MRIYFDSCNVVNSNQVSVKKYTFSDYFNTEFLDKSYAGRYSYYQKLAKVFLNTIPQELELLEQSISKKSHEGTRKVVHKIKNNFHWMGLHLVSTKAGLVELACKEQTVDWNDVEDLLDRMREACQHVSSESERLNSYLSTSQHSI